MHLGVEVLQYAAVRLENTRYYRSTDHLFRDVRHLLVVPSADISTRRSFKLLWKFFLSLVIKQKTLSDISSSRHSANLGRERHLR